MPAARAQNSLRDVVEVLVLVVVIFLGIKLSFESRPIEGTSMEPGLHDKQYVLINKLDYLFGTPQRGDVLIFHFPLDTNQIFIKRIIGLPGDTIVVGPKTVTVNGVVLNEPYLSAADNCFVFAPNPCPPPKTTKLGVNEYWVMGDNRLVSEDSRIWGPLDKSFIIGKASAVWWPLSAFHGIDGHHDVFSKAGAARGMTQTGDPLALLCCLPLGAAALRGRRMQATGR
ncbi:MAG: signal peptidase I [Ktedonobacterales bacterium]|nr:signal peptidase I [Ktedonobacterales bacterium]